MGEVEESARLKITHAYGAHLAGLIGLLHGPPGAEDVTVGLVNQEKVDIVSSEFAETFIDGSSRFLLAVVADPNFGNKEYLLAGNATFDNSRTDSLFIVIGLGRVDESVTDGECVSDAALRFLRRNLEYAVSQKGHLDAVGKGCVLHNGIELSVIVSHLRLLNAGAGHTGGEDHG